MGRGDQARQCEARVSPIEGAADRPRPLPALGLAHLPTPLEPMRRLSAHLGGPRLWVKREDCTGPRLWRQQAAQARLRAARGDREQAPTRWSRAAWCNPTASARSRPRRRSSASHCHLAVYHGRLAPPSPDYEKTGNALLNRLFGAHLHDVPWNGDRNGAIDALANGCARRGPQALCRALRRVECAGRGRLCLDRRSRSREQSPRSASRRRRSCIAPAAPARRPGWWSARRPACRGTRVVGIDIDAEPERVRADVIDLRAGPRPICSTGRSTRPTSRSSPAMPARPTACRMPRRSRRSGSARRARGAGARPGLFRQGAGRADRPDPRRPLDRRPGRRFHPYRRRAGAVRLSSSVRLTGDPRCSTRKPAAARPDGAGREGRAPPAADPALRQGARRGRQDVGG